MADNFSQMNPMHGIYSEFRKLLSTLVIKYSYLAEENETFESKREADIYLSCKDGRDTFFTYRDYTGDELYAAGITNASLIAEYTSQDGYLKIKPEYRNTLLQIRRNSIINNYVEKNDYYRELNGLPPLNTPKNKFHYVPDEYVNRYDIDKNIPIHEIQDYYNKISFGKGDYFISVLETEGLLSKLKTRYPEDKYLNHIGELRIPFDVARNAKNFQLLYINKNLSPNLIVEEFINAYEQSRDYHVSAIFVREYRNIIPYYDQFIALCILCMSIEIVLNRQFNLGINRKYYNHQSLKFLYDMYGVPHNMNIDEFTQQTMSQSVNMLIQEKSTDNVFFHIANILGFRDLKLYRYYLTKERKFDIYGAPIIEYIEKFNSDSGEIEKVLDYEKMYDVYFQKVELGDADFAQSYMIATNREKYKTITDNDPFWWNDENTFNTVWETEYNFVESKYLSVGISYKMSEIMYDNILLFKLLMSKKDMLNSITFTLPKINEGLSVTLFDCVILLFCLTAKKHNLRGEIISIPTQVESVLDYLHDTNGGEEYLVNSYGFDFDIFTSPKGQEMLNNINDILDNDDSERFISYISTLTAYSENLSNDAKISLINNIFTSVKGLSEYLQYLMAKTSDRKTYEILKKFYNTAFYSKEVKSIFTINENNAELKRTAKTFFEFLYYYNPKLYSTLFTPNYELQYNEYMFNNNGEINPNEYTLDDYIRDVEYGNIDDFTYSSLNTNNTDIQVTDDLIYYYIDHVISRLEIYIHNLRLINKINNTTTPIEDLLIKLINFFKSFTVDMLGIDMLYVIDLRSENTIKLLDEVASIIKNLEVDDNIRLSYSDVVHLIEVIFDNNKDTMPFNDKVLYNAYVSMNQDPQGNKYNNLSLSDMISYIEYNIGVVSDSSENTLNLNDNIGHINKTIVSDKNTENNILFRDKMENTTITDTFNDKSATFSDIISTNSNINMVTNPRDNILKAIDVVNSVNASITTHDKCNKHSLFTDKITYKYYT